MHLLFSSTSFRPSLDCLQPKPYTIPAHGVCTLSLTGKTLNRKGQPYTPKPRPLDLHLQGQVGLFQLHTSSAPGKQNPTLRRHLTKTRKSKPKSPKHKGVILKLETPKPSNHPNAELENRCTAWSPHHLRSVPYLRLPRWSSVRLALRGDRIRGTLGDVDPLNKVPVLREPEEGSEGSPFEGSPLSYLGFETTGCSGLWGMSRCRLLLRPLQIRKSWGRFGRLFGAATQGQNPQHNISFYIEYL